MNAATNTDGVGRVLVYERRVEGHHVGNLRFITEDLLAAGFELTLAIDLRPASLSRIREQMGPLLDRVKVIAADGDSGKASGSDGDGTVKTARHPRMGSSAGINQAVRWLVESGARCVFMATFDDVASDLLRRAAFGRMPPAALRGRLGGIYSRFRFLTGSRLSPNSWLKQIGFNRLLRDQWLAPLLIPDPYLHASLKQKYPAASLWCMPDPFPDDFAVERASALRHFALPPDQKIFLFYGGPYRRKGLHLAVQAWLKLPENIPAFLLCAGERAQDRQVLDGLAELVRRGRAKVVNRYISAEEEKMAFAATDWVLLPYVKHTTSSGVLSRAVGAQKPVIVSDEQLLGRLVREHQLGLLFPTGNAAALQAIVERASSATPAEMRDWQAAAGRYSSQCSRAAYRSAVIQAIATVVRGQSPL